MKSTPEQDAIDFVKGNKKVFIDHVLNQFTGEPPNNPVAVFMAGTPGAGKTELALSLIDIFDHSPVHIDADNFRQFIPGYNGSNSEIVQPAASIAVDKAVDAVIGKGVPFILDGTFAVGKALVNIKRAHRHNYDTQIYFVYQDPIDAWTFTKLREKIEGRRVPKEAFIHAYFASRSNVISVLEETDLPVTVHVITKNYTTGEHQTYANVKNIEDVLPRMYNKDELKEILND